MARTPALTKRQAWQKLLEQLANREGLQGAPFRVDLGHSELSSYARGRDQRRI